MTDPLDAARRALELRAHIDAMVPCAARRRELNRYKAHAANHVAPIASALIEAREEVERLAMAELAMTEALAVCPWCKELPVIVPGEFPRGSHVCNKLNFRFEATAEAFAAVWNAIARPPLAAAAPSSAALRPGERARIRAEAKKEVLIEISGRAHAAICAWNDQPFNDAMQRVGEWVNALAATEEAKATGKERG